MENLDTRFLRIERHNIATKGGFLSSVESVVYAGTANREEAEVLLKDLLFDALDEQSDERILKGTTVCCLVAYHPEDQEDIIGWIEGRVTTDNKMTDQDEVDIGKQLDSLISDFEIPMGEGSVNAIQADLGVTGFTDYSCFATVQCGILSSSAMLTDGSCGDTWSEVTAPESQAFLDKVNKHFETHFKMDHFSAG